MKKKISASLSNFRKRIRPVSEAFTQLKKKSNQKDTEKECRLASARAKPRRSSVDVRDVRLDEYEESLATRVRSLQRAFPDAADDIAEVVRRFDEDVVGTTRAETNARPVGVDARHHPRIVARQARNIERSKRVEAAPKVVEKRKSSHTPK